MNIYTTTIAGQSLTAKFFNGNTQIGSDIALTESTAVPGYYYAMNVDTSGYQNGEHALIILDEIGNIVGHTAVKFFDGVEVIDLVKKLTRNKVRKNGQYIDIYDDDDVSVFLSFDLGGGGRVLVP